MSIDPFDERLKRHAEAIGFVCIHWTWLEQIADAAFAHLMNHEVNSLEMHCISVNADFRDKLKMLRAIASVRKPSDDWFDRMDTLINKIDNDLRLRRNRVVHDHWFPGDAPDIATRVQGQTTFKKAQSRQPKTMTTHEEVEMSVAEVAAISEEITRATYAMFELMHKVQGFTESLETME